MFQGPQTYLSLTCPFSKTTPTFIHLTTHKCLFLPYCLPNYSQDNLISIIIIFQWRGLWLPHRGQSAPVQRLQGIIPPQGSATLISAKLHRQKTTWIKHLISTGFPCTGIRAQDTFHGSFTWFLSDLLAIPKHRQTQKILQAWVSTPKGKSISQLSHMNFLVSQCFHKIYVYTIL